MTWDSLDEGVDRIVVSSKRVWLPEVEIFQEVQIIIIIIIMYHKLFNLTKEHYTDFSITSWEIIKLAICQLVSEDGFNLV